VANLLILKTQYFTTEKMKYQEKPPERINFFLLKYILGKKCASGHLPAVLIQYL